LATQEPALPTGELPAVDATPPGGVLLPSARPRRRGRRVLWLLAALVLLAVGYYLVSLYQVWSTGRADQARPVDAIVVMGAAQYDGRPSPQLAARLDHVVELWQAGLAPVVVVTGGNRPGDRFTEAESSTAYLVDRGVPADAIVGEDEGSTSWESLRAVADLLGPLELDRVLLVSDPFHSLRIRLMAEQLGLEAYTSPTRTSPVGGWSAFQHHLQEAGGVALGRLLGFDRVESLTG
jgi:uncharacterized SAM-binding protein YcdF (DUF218 family)